MPLECLTVWIMMTATIFVILYLITFVVFKILGREMTNTMTALLVAFAGIPVMIHLLYTFPFYVQEKRGVARAAGMSAKLAEEVFYLDQKEGEKHYTSDLNLLLKIDKNLTENPNVTFVFLHASKSGFTLYTEHARDRGSGKKTITFTD